VRKTVLLLAALFAVVLIAATACSQATNMPGAAVDQPGGRNVPAPTQPAAPKEPGGVVPVAPPAGGAFDSPLAYVQSLPPTQRLDWQDVQEACGASPECLNELAKFETYLRQICPDGPTCTDLVAKLLYEQRTSAERQAGIYPATYPQAKDVLDAVIASQQAEAPVVPPAPGAAEGATSTSEIVALVVDKLSQPSAPPSVAWTDVVAIIGQVAPQPPSLASDTAAQLELVMKAAQSADPFYDVYQKLMSNDVVPTADAIPALTSAASATGNP
jgi:hypothetical protein